MRKLTLALLALALVATTSDADAKKKHTPKKAQIQTGDPLPKKPVKSAQCHDKGAMRFIGSGPSTPLAIVKKGKVDDAGVGCCAPWAVKGAKYQTVDAFGQIVGEAEISGGEGYDVSQCYELGFATKKGKAGVGVYVDPAFKAPKSVAWTPTPKEQAALIKVVADLEQAMVATSSYKCPDAKLHPFAQRALFFSFEHDQTVPLHYAVVGGPLLLVARLQADGRWIVRDLSTAQTDSCQPQAYEPRAVFDMNGDGEPEIIVHEDYGDSFGDLVLGYEFNGFRLVAAAVAGSTA